MTMIEYKTNWQLRKVITHRNHYYYGEHKTKIVVLRNGREIPSDLQHHLNQIAQFFKTDPTTRKWWYKSETTLMRMAIASFESHLYLYGKSLESVHKVVEPECCKCPHINRYERLSKKLARIDVLRSQIKEELHDYDRRTTSP